MKAWLLVCWRAVEMIFAALEWGCGGMIAGYVCYFVAAVVIVSSGGDISSQVAVWLVVTFGALGLLLHIGLLVHHWAKKRRR